jgi:leucyl/phenylalanyl-tRNA---protein transferase
VVHITPQLLLRAYAAGVFPMAEDAGSRELNWVDPDIRGVLPLERFHIPHSLRKAVRHQPYTVRVDTAFSDVIAACAQPRPERPTTWINIRILDLYTELHDLGHAHSVEAWKDGTLVGGLYGIRLGAAFFGESMFSHQTNASKIALVHLVARLKAGSFMLLDAQFTNPHLEQFGIEKVARAKYKRILAKAIEAEADFGLFKSDHLAEDVLKVASAPHTLASS